MNKLILTFLSTVATVFFANAEVLLWQVYSPVTISGSDYEWDTATIFSTSDNTASGGEALTSLWGKNSQNEQVAAETFNEYAVGAYLQNSSTDTNFYIELYKNSSKVAYSDVVNIATLRTDFVKSGLSMQSIGAGTGWDGGHFTAVPEPTSGLMLLLGAAMLGLRRKRIA